MSVDLIIASHLMDLYSAGVARCRMLISITQKQPHTAGDADRHLAIGERVIANERNKNSGNSYSIHVLYICDMQGS